MNRTNGRPFRMVCLAVVLLFAASGCGGADANPSEEPPTSAPPSVSDGQDTSTDPSPEPSMSATPGVSDGQDSSTEPSVSATPGVADGRYSGYLTALDAADRTVTWDQFEFLTGEDAEQAWAEDHPGEEGGPIYDFYMVDNHPGLVTLPVATDVQVSVRDLSGARPTPFAIDFAQLPDHVANDPNTEDDRLWPMPFWFTVQNGTVVGVDEQYMP